MACKVDTTKLAALQNNLAQAKQVLAICTGSQGGSATPKCGVAVINAAQTLITALQADINAVQNACQPSFLGSHTFANSNTFTL